MAIEAPKIDERTFADIVRQILGDPETKGLRDYYTPGWTSTSSGAPGVVMVNLFARLMEIIIERLNAVPDKQFVAFLDLVGIDRLPGSPARAPVQFFLAQDIISGGEIPAGTQVATTQTETEDSFIFETEKKFFLSPARLQSVFDLYPYEDKYDDLTALIDASSSTKFAVFTTKSKLIFEHILYIEHDTLFGHKMPVDITLKIQTIENLFIRDWKIEWRGSKKEGDWKPLTIEDDTTNNFRNVDGHVKIKELVGLEKAEIQEIKSYWISAKLTTPIMPGIKLPTIKSLTIQIASTDEALAVPQSMLDHAFFNNIPLDVQKDFFPFGETPKFNDTFYFANEEVLSQKNQRITINVSLSDALEVPSPDPETSIIKLRWEYWHQEEGKQDRWEFLGESSNISSTPSADNPFNFEDNTLAFTIYSTIGTIKFNCPDYIAKTEVNRAENYWIRARIVDGDYGRPAKVEILSPPDGFIYHEATYKPPSIQSFLLSYVILDDTSYPPQHCYTFNNRQYIDRIENGQLKTPFLPFEGIKDTDPALYLGFDNTLGNVPISIYIDVKEKVVPRQFPPAAINLESSKTSDSDTPRISWDYFNGAAWSRLNVLDGTANFTIRGTIEFIGPSDSAPTVKFGLEEKYWIRARLESGSYDEPPEIEGIFFNTVWVKNIVTEKEELIGSSTGQLNQSFLLSQKPVLEGEQIYIRELELPPFEEKQTLEKIFGKSAVETRENETTGEKEFWIRWLKVDNFHGSGPKSRHYILDRVSGEITFGDGKKGMIPSLGTNNIKALIYQAGGSVAANQAAAIGQIKELKSSIPYVAKVTNVSNAKGGSDPETVTMVKIRGPQAIKNRHRAITVQDFVWLTKQASTQVALVKCLSTTNKDLQFQPGAVAIIIVPRSDEVKPLPSQQLINQIKTYLSERTEATVSKNISVIGPYYLRIDVTAKVQPQKPEEAKTVEQAIFKNLGTFLHPLKGGAEGGGWEFGRDVYISEIFEVIEGTSGVDHVETLRIQSSFWEEELVFVNPSERFDMGIPAGAPISSTSGDIKLFLAEPIPARVNVSSIIIRGFQIGDRIMLKKQDSTKSQELEITRILKDTLYFNTFNLSDSFDEGSQVIAVDKDIQALLAEDLPINIDINSIRIRAFEGTGFPVKIQPHPTAVGETKIISRIEKSLQRIPVDNYSLVYSGLHDVQMTQ